MHGIVLPLPLLLPAHPSTSPSCLTPGQVLRGAIRLACWGAPPPPIGRAFAGRSRRSRDHDAWRATTKPFWLKPMTEVKRRRLAHLGRDAHVSASGLEHLLRQLRDEGGVIPAAFSSSSQRRARQSVAFQSTTFGKLIQQRSVPSKTVGKPVQLFFQHPFAFLEAACKTCAEFRAILTRVLDDSNNRVSICLYTDEITPGQALQPHNTRKTQAVYWTLKEFGFPILSCELAWMTICAPRTDTVAELRGGMAELFRYAVKFFFGGPSGHDLRNGISLFIEGENSPRLVTGCTGMLVQDERGHKFSTGVKGSGGIKICALCKNIAAFKC
eukprot:1238994-Pyramimonas_sp.AAC.1